MPGLLDSCRELYDTTDLYEVLGIKKDAAQHEVKRAYHKTSLRVHPDRVEAEEKEAATAKFQTLGKVYSVLSDKDKRAVYDETGEVDDEDVTTQDRDWYDYWRLLFSKVSVKDIQEFEEKYKGSEEEVNDLRAAYIDYNGDMDQIIDNVLCATIDDEDRFRAVLQSLIDADDLPALPAFTAEKKKKKKRRQQKAAAEAEEAEQYKQELGLGDGDDALRQMIMQRKSARAAQADDFFAQLEAKYAKPGGKKKKKGKK